MFDNLNQIASIDVSLKGSPRNALWPAPSLGAGFEDVATDRQTGTTFALIESVEDTDGSLRGFIAEYDRDRRLRQCARLSGRFEKANKGFEGLAHARYQGREYLYALREAIWKESRRIALPKEARFEDYSALAIRNGRIAVVSQQSGRLWVGELEARTQTVTRGSGAVYRFPGKNYRNVEGIDWLTKDTLIAVSDRVKKDQPLRCAGTDQSIHIFRIPR